MTKRYFTYEFGWYYVEKSKKILPLLVSENSVENFIDKTSVNIESAISDEKLLKVFEENYGKGKLYTSSDFIYKILNIKERAQFPGDAERNGLSFCKFDRKGIVKISKVFTRAINRYNKEKKFKQELEIEL